MLLLLESLRNKDFAQKSQKTNHSTRVHIESLIHPKKGCLSKQELERISQHLSEYGRPAKKQQPQAKNQMIMQPNTAILSLLLLLLFHECFHFPV